MGGKVLLERVRLLIERVSRYVGERKLGERGLEITVGRRKEMRALLLGVLSLNTLRQYLKCDFL